MRRFLLAFPVAVLVSYGLIGLMAWMVDLNTRNLQAETPPLQFDIYVAEQEESSQRRSRTLPEPVAKVPEPPEVSETKPLVQRKTTVPALAPVPELKMDLSVSGLSLTVPVTAAPENIAGESSPDGVPEPAPVQIGQTQQVMPLHRTEPLYPRKALQRKIEGYVILSFDISGSGRPENIRVEEAQPARVFNREAMKALRSWRYQPMMVNGEARVRTAQKVRLEFRIR